MGGTCVRVHVCGWRTKTPSINFKVILIYFFSGKLANKMKMSHRRRCRGRRM